MEIKIHPTPETETMRFAASELKRYLNLMSKSGAVAFVEWEKLTDDQTSERKLINLKIAEPGDTLAHIIDDPERDDAFRIEITHSQGVIIGTNSRSVLFGVYRFLENQGCRWFRPGPDGEIVPDQNIENLETSLTEKAHYRYRGKNNCGSYGIENILDTIDWVPKVGMNMFFNEFFLPAHLYNRWYGHEYPSIFAPNPRSDMEIQAFHQKTIREIKKRGLLYHACGHDWTGKALGLSDAECGIPDPEYFSFLDDDKRKFLAQVNGERRIDPKGPRYTDLCYGNSQVRDSLIRCVADYAFEHPEADLIHFWLSDLMNVSCECPLCRNTLPSDFYIMMLNGIDKELERRGSSARICFLVYQELYWAPEKVRFNNPDRFVLMFAPSRRNYTEPYALDDEGLSLPPFTLNRNTRLSDNREYAASLRDWRKIFPGESFIFDYHMTYTHYLDQGYFGFTKILSEDIRRTGPLGFGGFVSCQVLRSFFPTGYPMYLHARMLWDPGIDAENAAEYYFESAYGRMGHAALEYMKSLSSVFFSKAVYDSYTGAAGKVNTDAARKFEGIPELVERFRKSVEQGIQETEGSIRKSWEYLLIHADLVLPMAQALKSRFQGNRDLCFQYWKNAVAYITAREEDIQPVLDLFWFFRSLEDRYEIFEKTGDHEKWVYED